MSVTIPPLDLTWLLIESPVSTTHVGALMLFEKPARRTGVVRDVVEAYRSFELTPPFNYAPDLLTTGAPCFNEIDDWDPAYHIQHISLPDGASYDDLLRLIADLHEPMLDRDRPLFRCWVIDGVPDNRFVVYTKVHHAIIDGISGLKMLYAGLSTTAEATVPPPAFALRRKRREPRSAPALFERITGALRSTATQAGALGEVSVGAVRKILSGVVGAELQGSVPFGARSAPTNKPLKQGRGVATLSLNIQDMRDIGHHFGGTLNDVAVTIIDAGVHEYLRRTGDAFDHRLVAMCPVSLRKEGDTAMGTRVSAMFTRLGEPRASAVERIHQVIDSMKVAKKELGAMSPDAALIYVTGIVGIAGLTSSTKLDRVAGPVCNLVISNVPGARETRYLNGARLLGLYPISALAASVGLNATLSSYHDQMDFGFVASTASVRDPALLAECTLEAFEQLKKAAATKTAKKTAAKKTAAKKPAARH